MRSFLCIFALMISTAAVAQETPIILKDGVPLVSRPELDASKVAELVRAGIWTEADLEKAGLVAAEPFKAPDGKVVVGEPSYVESKGAWKQVYDVEDVPPPPPEPTPAEKIEQSLGGVTPEQFREWLAK